MKIFPAIDIKDKKCVRLVKGDFDNKTEYKIYPVDQAHKYKDHGFKNLHIVDLDGALTGETVNLNMSLMNHYKKIISLTFTMGIGLFMLQTSALGAQRWLSIGSLNLQPSEFAKLTVIFMLAAVLERRYIAHPLNLLKPLGVIFLPWVLVFRYLI